MALGSPESISTLTMPYLLPRDPSKTDLHPQRGSVQLSFKPPVITSPDIRFRSSEGAKSNLNTRQSAQPADLWNVVRVGKIKRRDTFQFRHNCN